MRLDFSRLPFGKIIIFRNVTACTTRISAIYFFKNIALVPGPSLSSFPFFNFNDCGAMTSAT
jgi:hypothetical protein